MDINTLKQLLELGWPAIITVFFGYLAVQYIADQRQQIKTLWERLIALEGEMAKVKQQFVADHLQRENRDK